MQTSKTEKYVYHFVYFLTFTMGINVPGLSPDYLIEIVEQIQGGCVTTLNRLQRSMAEGWFLGFGLRF
jgi:hypothetical protein